MTIEQGLVAHLLADVGVSAIVGTRVHPLAIPQNGALPAVVYERVSANREPIVSGTTGTSPLLTVRMRVDCWATSYGGAKSLSEAVRAALNGVGLSSPMLLGSEPVQLVNLDTDADLSEMDGDQRLYRVQQDWLIMHLE